jgi:hypothetical protein
MSDESDLMDYVKLLEKLPERKCCIVLRKGKENTTP